LRGGGLPLRGGEGHLDSVEVALQPAHLTGGVGEALAGLYCPMDKLMELTLVI
jgi:hypothetical protein